MNRKGDAFQIPVVLTIVFVCGIVGLLMLTLSGKINTFWLESGMLNNTENPTAVNAVTKIQATSVPTTDYMIFFIFLGSNIALLVSAVKTKFSPTVIFFFILLLFITIIISMGLVQVYQGFATADVTSEFASQLTLTNFIFSRYTPLIMTCIGILSMLIMWGKSGGDIVT
jgi:hypothetical protein